MAETQHDVQLIGVDAGGSSTRAVLLDRTGRCLGYARAGSGNPIAAGAALAAANVVEAVLGATAAVGTRAVARVAVAMAGAAGRASEWLEGPLRSAGIDGAVTIEADLAAVYLSGSRAALGYAAIGGTGAIAARLRDHAIERVADGLGWLAGDDGSGFWIGRNVVRAVAADLDDRGPRTLLTAAVLGSLGVDSSPGPVDAHARPPALGAMVEAVYAERPVLLARFAATAFEVAANGDAVAQRIVAEAARRIAATLASVVGSGAQRDAPVVLGGGVLAGQPVMQDAVRAALGSAGVSGAVIAVPDGVVGSAVLALERHGIRVDEPTAERIGETLAKLREERGGNP